MKPQPLFTVPDAFFRSAMEALSLVVDRVMPQNRAQARELPKACRELSALLTTERHGLARPYWASPRLTSAYLRYFLPWNLVRFGTLLPTLDLGGAVRRENPVLLDMGSGPLTFPLALWMSRPDLRALPLTVIATDSSPRSLELGRDIFEALRRDLLPTCPWVVRTVRAPLHLAPRQVIGKEGRPFLITMGNVLNEWEGKGRQGNHLLARLGELVEDLDRALAPDGRILAIEPGTRLGGKLIVSLRHVALGGEPDLADPDDEDEADAMFAAPVPVFQPLSPCPHSAVCPMLRQKGSAWCHLNGPGDTAPAGLRALSREAGLDKDSISLSYLLLGREKTGKSGRIAVDKDQTGCRIISDAFVLPGYPGRARYACTPRGLALVVDSAFLKSGDFVGILPLNKRDFKSGAWIYSLPGRQDRPVLAEKPDRERLPSGPDRDGMPHKERGGQAARHPGARKARRNGSPLSGGRKAGPGAKPKDGRKSGSRS